MWGCDCCRWCLASGGDGLRFLLPHLPSGPTLGLSGQLTAGGVWHFQSSFWEVLWTSGARCVWSEGGQRPGERQPLAFRLALRLCWGLSGLALHFLLLGVVKVVLLTEPEGFSSPGMQFLRGQGWSARGPPGVTEAGGHQARAVTPASCSGGPVCLVGV